MKKIVFIQRNKTAGFSIDKVSRPIIDNIENKVELTVPCHGASIKDILKNLWFVLKNRRKDVIYHITGDIHYCLLSLIGARTVLTVHDTVTLDFNTEKDIKYYIKKILWFTLPLKIANSIVCISEETKKQLKKYTDRNDLIVIHNSVDQNIKTTPRNPIKDYFEVLIIGTKKNKNIERMLHALSLFNCRVTIIGKLTNDQKKLIKDLGVNVINKYNLSDEGLRQEYYKADLVMFVSLFEGFGMPVLEANKAGRPIICSNIPVLKEVGKDAALYVDPYDIKSIENGIKKLLSDEYLQAELVQNGIVNAKNHEISQLIWKWEKIYSSLS